MPPSETAEGPGPHTGCRNVTPVLNRVGDKWSMLIVMILSTGPHRFSELKRAIDGISQRMLTLSLRGLRLRRVARVRHSIGQSRLILAHCRSKDTR